MDNANLLLHQGQPVLSARASISQAMTAVLMLHGRGADASSILSLAEELTLSEQAEREGIAYLAPQAVGNSWYPNSFLAPIASNEPWLSSALRVVHDLLQQVEKAGIPVERTLLLGFSQGACLALEFAARNARRYGGVIGLSGGLIGPDETPRNYPGSFAGTPVFLGCGDTDIYIHKDRVHLTAKVLERMGAEVTLRLYPNLGHTINQDELISIRRMILLS